MFFRITQLVLAVNHTDTDSTDGFGNVLASFGFMPKTVPF